MELEPLFTEVPSCTIEVDWNYVPESYHYITGKPVFCYDQLRKDILKMDEEITDGTLEVVKLLLERKEISSVEKIIYIADIEVEKEYRKRKIATKAIENLSDLARSNGFEYVLCECGSNAGERLFCSLDYEVFDNKVMGKRL